MGPPAVALAQPSQQSRFAQPPPPPPSSAPSTTNQAASPGHPPSIFSGSTASQARQASALLPPNAMTAPLPLDCIRWVPTDSGLMLCLSNHPAGEILWQAAADSDLY